MLGIALETLFCNTDKERSVDKNIPKYDFFPNIFSNTPRPAKSISYLPEQLYPPLQEKRQFRFVLQNREKHLCTSKRQSRNDWVTSFSGHQADGSSEGLDWALEKPLMVLTLGHWTLAKASLSASLLRRGSRVCSFRKEITGAQRRACQNPQRSSVAEQGPSRTEHVETRSQAVSRLWPEAALG